MTWATAAEFCGILVAVVLRADFTHFTWWSIASYLVFLGAWLAGRGRWLWVFAATFQILVVLGVAGMSLVGCDLIRDAAAEMGPALYVLGNFAVHYWPLVGISLRTSRPAYLTNQTLAAVLTFLWYCALKRPETVYGCPVPYNVVVVSGFVAGTSVSVLFESHAGAAEYWASL